MSAVDNPDHQRILALRKHGYHSGQQQQEQRQLHLRNTPNCPKLTTNQNRTPTHPSVAKVTSDQ
jgi:hypothetical protein